MEDYVLDFLQKNNIKYILHKHIPVFTVAESDLLPEMPGMRCKNLFLKDRHSESYFLITMSSHDRLDIKKMSLQLGVKALTFGSPEKLLELLKLTPGSVSPLGIINDKNEEVKFIIAKKVWDADIVQFHPNINSETLELNKAEFHKLILATKHNYEIIDV